MRVCVVFSLILFLSACSERPLLPMGLGSLGLGRAQPQSDRAATKPDGLRAVGGQVAGADLPRTGVPATGGDGEKTVSLSFSDTDIRDVAQTILGSILGVTFTIDPSIQGTVSLAGNSPVPREEVVPTLETLLGQVNAALIVSNGLYQIVPAERAASQGGLLGPKDDGSGTEILVLRVGSARRIAEMLAPFVPQATRLSPEANRNALLVTGPRAARRSLIDLVRVFDTDVAANTHFVLLEVRRGTPAKAATDLSKALGAGQDGMLSDVVRVLPIEQSGAILVTSANRKLVDRAAALFRRMDGMASLKERTMHVYYVQNGDVSDLLPTLRGAFNLAVEGESRGAGTTVPGQATADLSAPASPPDSRPKQQGATRGSGQGLAASAPASNDESQDPEGLAQGSPNPGGSSGENRMRILSSKRNNALLVYATEAEYQQVYGVLRRIDIRSAQVLIEATIAEVTLNDELQFGTKAYFQTKWGSISLNEKITASGGVFSIKQASPSFAIEALQGVTKVKILSAPQLMVMDNEKARLQVGTTVPIQTQAAQSTTTAGAPVINSIEYRDTGVVLEITPRVAGNGLVTLDLQQTVSSVAPTTSSTINSPTFDERRVKSRIAADDGDTIAIAGLIRTQETDKSSGIPLLSTIPVIGGAFGTTSSRQERTELLVLITPHVVNDGNDARTLTAALRNRLGSSFAETIRAADIPAANRGAKP